MEETVGVGFVLVELQQQCASIRLVSSTVDLQAFDDQSRRQDIEYEMQVVDVTAGPLDPVARVAAVQPPCAQTPHPSATGCR